MRRVFLCLAVFILSAAHGFCAASTHPGMGATPYTGGVTFRVWAPNATSVNVAGSFNNWSTTANSLTLENASTGLWSVDVPAAAVGNPYKFVINGNIWKQDPRARQVLAPDGNGVIYKTDAFDWGNDTSFTRPSKKDVIIYEMHIGTFNAPSGIPGGFDNAILKLDYLAALGVTVLDIMPVASFAPSAQSWGYDPRGIFAVEQTYGGPDAFKRFVKEAHARGMAVHLDTVHNHYGGVGSAGDLWNFDGWSGSGNGGGIYFNQNNTTSWGPLPDYSRQGVRDFITDNIKMWLDEYHVDGFRWDAVEVITNDSFGLTLINSSNAFIHTYPGRMSVGEGSYKPGPDWFDSNWWTYYPNRLVPILSASVDANRDMKILRDQLLITTAGASDLTTVIYTDSHDTAGDLNQGNRLPTRISPSSPTDYWARKRSMLGAAFVFTTPSIPLILQGQEMLETRQFSSGTALNWNNVTTYAPILNFYKDLIKLRRNIPGKTAGLRGGNVKVMNFDNSATGKYMAYYRWDKAGVNDDTLVVINLLGSTQTLPIVFPRVGTWTLAMNTDAQTYGADFGNVGTTNVAVAADNVSANVTIAPYSALIYSHSAAPDADGDGIPDYWETQHGFNPNDPSDASLDSDGDGFSTLQEYVNYGDPHLNLAQSLNVSSNVPIATGGDAPWFDQTLITHDGISAAQCGNVGNGQSSYFEIPVTGPQISFWWKVSSEANWDFLKVYVDGTLMNKISGEADWTQVLLPIPSGSHILRFSFEKDFYDSNGNNAAWVDLLTTLPDSDGDGIADYWEIQNGLNPNDPSDALLDPDGDGVSNLQEYIKNGDPRFNLAQGLNLPATLPATNGGNASWFDQKTTTHDGVDAAQSGDISDNQTSFLEMPVHGPDTVSFWWKVSSEQNYDFLKVYLDGVQANSISGEVAWTQVTLQVPAGTHTLRFSFEKDSSVSRGSDAGWVDQIVVSFSERSQVVCNGNGSVSILWNAKAGRGYAVQYSDNLIAWQNLNANVYTSPTDATLTANDPTTPRPSRRFYRVMMAY